MKKLAILLPEALDSLYAIMAQNVVETRRAGFPLTAEEIAPYLSEGAAELGWLNGYIDPVRLAAEVARLEAL